MKLSDLVLTKSSLLIIVAILMAPINAVADKATALAKASQNPVASLISVPFENNAFRNTGPENKNLNVLNIKPVIPTSLGDDWNLINRAIVPVTSQPGFGSGPDGDRQNGVGDITYQGFFSPKKPTKDGWILGIGPQIQLPTHTNDRLGNKRWAMGPAFVALKMPGKWVFGSLISNVWDVSTLGDVNDESINMLTMQPFVNYNFGKGWYVTFAPVITADWEAGSGEKWTVPLGGGIGRVVHWGKQPINWRVAYYGNVSHPDDAPTYNIQFSATFLFPEKK
jgi:hypothetical protein